MRIDASSSQTQTINQLAAQQTREVPGERENDGDSDDGAKKTATTASYQQIKPQGVGTKVDFFA